MSTCLRTLMTATLMAFPATPALAADVVIELAPGDDFVIQDNASSELWSVDEATGEISRNGQLFLHSRGDVIANLFVGRFAGLSNTGFSNSAFGNQALFSNTSGGSNSAFGSHALDSNTTGGSNSAFGDSALSANVSGGTNSAFGSWALQSNVDGDGNSAFGWNSLSSNTADSNSAFGQSALSSNTTGLSNVAFGRSAMLSNTSGRWNSAFGRSSLQNNVFGWNNVAVGNSALLQNTSGSRNTGLGSSALNNTTGSDNIGVGSGAGINQTSGSDNIYIGNSGVAAESDKIRIGTEGTQNEAFMAGIVGNPVNSGTDEVVYVSPNGELRSGEVSSLRFKQDVRDMGDRSGSLMKLRPVTFRYKAAGAESAEAYGLIAEEVAEVAPELVRYDDEGRPHSVRYDLLPRMLLNEVQKQQTTIEDQAAVIAEQQMTLAELKVRLELLESRIGSGREGSNR